MTFAVILDTNVIASGILGFIRPDSTPGSIMRAWRAGRFDLYVSKPILNELERTLEKPYFTKAAPPNSIESSLQTIKRFGKEAEIVEPVSGVASHPADDVILATAISAEADYLVTGDRMLQALRSFRGVAIVSPSEFLEILDRTEPPPTPYPSW